MTSTLSPLANIPPEHIQIVKDHEQLKLLSIFRIVNGVMMCFFSLYALIYLFMGVMMCLIPSEFDSSTSDPDTASAMFVGVMFIVLGALFFLAMVGVALLSFLSAYGSSKRKWYWLSFVTSCFECFLFPYGTVVGVMGLIVYCRHSVKALFSKTQAQ